LNFIRYGEGNYVEFEAVTSLHKDLVATYVMVAVFNRVDLKQAVSDALSFATKALEFGIKNIDSVVPEVYASSIIDAERFKVINELAQAVNTIEENSQLIADLIPEVNMNIAYSLPKHFLKNLNDVAAIPGRITRVGNSVKAVSPPEFGASKHLARALMKVMEHSPEIRSIANIRFDTSILKIIEKLGYTHSFYDRSLEPPEIKSVEGATIPWGVGEAIKRVGYVPDVIYHKGDYGKEAMIAVLGRDPNDVVRKLLNIGRALKESEIRRWC
ncbi:MAG: thiamine-phosphate synthase family protein, partial [Sulfolobales archaeon]